jgi:DNA-3-methyladenine glycosylase II
MSKQAHRHLIDNSEVRYSEVHKLVSANGVIYLEKSAKENFFDFLANVVASQQLSNSAARTIFSRCENAASEADLSLIDFVSTMNADRLASCGLSRNKVKALFALKVAFAEGVLREGETLMPTCTDISERITSVWGLGQWSADMAAIFYYGLPDVWSGGDMSLQRGISALTGLPPEESLDVASYFSPYKSFLALHIWKGVDDGLL